MANVSSSNSQEANVPKLRFPGFEGEYSCKKLGQICEKVIRNDPESNAPIMMLSAASGFIYQSEKYSRENAGKSLKKYTLLKAGELAFNHGASKIKKYGCCYELTVPEARIPYVYHTFKIIDEDCHIPYIAQLLNNPLIDNQLKRLVSSSVRLDGLLNISYNEYMTISLNLPQKDEQEKIEKFLALLNQRIVKQQQLINALKLYKRGALSRLFPKRGSRVPEYRFAGFTDDWEQRKLGDEVTEILAGGDIDKDKIVENGKYPIYANALSGDGIVGYYNDYYRVKAPAITVTGRGEVGHAQARMSDFTPVVRLLAIRSRHDCYFLENAINNHKVIVESTGVPQLTVPQLSSYDICFPNDIGEEVKIGGYFHELDHLITLHQRKLDKYKSIKQGLLEKLFI